MLRTGFYTAKGELIRSILFPKKFEFKFHKDAANFVLFMAAIAAVGMAYSISLYVQRGVRVPSHFLSKIRIMDKENIAQIELRFQCLNLVKLFGYL